jgi:circadian clock protein KaiC
MQDEFDQARALGSPGAGSLFDSAVGTQGGPHATVGGTKRTLGSGVPGLDDILNGGFPTQRFYLIEGTPGSGKTTLALQYLLEGRNRDERGLYVTLSETTEELHDVAGSHGWNLDGITLLDTTATAEVATAEAQYTVFHPSEVELQNTVDGVLSKVESVRPTRVVLDSLSDMRLLARDPLRFRRQILSLKQFFASHDITVLMLDDLSADDPDMQLHSLAHGVLHLDQIALAHGAERRRLRVMKLRGVRFHAGYHDFMIRTGGLEVFPRIRLGETPTTLPPERLRSNSRELDELLGGGIPTGTGVLITGSPGTGKSVLATQYAAAAADRGERVTLYLFDERIGTFLDRAAGLKMRLEHHIGTGRMALVQLEPTEISPGEFTSRVIRAASEGSRVIVIDSLNGFTKAMVQEKHLTVRLHELLSYLGSRGVTTLLTLAQRGVFGSVPEEAPDVSYLADAVVLLRYFESHGEVRRAISVFKQRSADHERTIREFKLGPGGLRVGNPLREFQGVLTGLPTYIGRTGELLVQRGNAAPPTPTSE